MATIWLTYAWADNKHEDVDYLSQELETSGLKVILDRWAISAGHRLWEQIDSGIRNPANCDGWAIYATANSLASEPCREELAYALDRALSERGESFPLVGIFPSPVDESLIPGAIKTRLYVSLTELDWKERVIAAVEGRAPTITRLELQPYHLQYHDGPNDGVFIEVRPRAGTWSPFIAAVPIKEKEALTSIFHGASGRPPKESVLFSAKRGQSPDGKWWCSQASNEATPAQSYYIRCSRLPSQLHFGVPEGQAFTVTLR